MHEGPDERIIHQEEKSSYDLKDPFRKLLLKQLYVSAPLPPIDS